MANASLKAFCSVRPGFGRPCKAASTGAAWLVPMSLLLLSGCVTPKSAYFCLSEGRVQQRRIEDVLRQNPLAPDANARVTTLGGSGSVSHHPVQVRFGESLHVHETHDLIVSIYRGNGTLQLRANTIPPAVADFAFIPRGVPHASHNQGSTSAVAVAVVTPAFDGRDTVPADAKE